MSGNQVTDKPNRSPSHASDNELPPHPAYFRRREDTVEGMDGLRVQQYPATLGHSPERKASLDGRGGEYSVSDEFRLVPPTVQFVPPPVVRSERSLSPVQQQALRQDSYAELSDGLNGISLSDASLPDSSQGVRTGLDSAVVEGAISAHQQSSALAYDDYADPSPNTYYQPENGYSWLPSSHDYSSPYHVQQAQNVFDPYAVAASNVLGGGPPTDGQSVYTSIKPPSLSDQFVPQTTTVHPNTAIAHEGYSLSHSSTSFPHAEDEQTASDEFAFPDDISLSCPNGQDGTGNQLRPSLHRSGTTGSVSLGTRKMKAVDLSAPPYTKEFIDEYRQRIKNDPDPETHFRYARYLIDAARNIGSKAADQRAVRKYRELLVQEALKVFRRLATQGEPYAEAQFFLANCYGTGMLGLQVDHERAYHLYLQAAKQNHSAAAYRVAVCNEIGAGTRKEPPRAFAFYRKAASLGDTAAMYKLGMILLSGGLGQPPNPREAVAWLRRAAEQADEDNPHALHELGLLHENPESKIVPYDSLYAKNLFTKAAQLGYTQSQFKLGQCYEYGNLTCPVDPRRSIGWYTKAAEKGNAEAELALSGWYLTGSDGVLKQSDSEAYLWARRAANRGLSTAEYAVGYFSETGIGVKQDIELAKRWYMRAAAQGNKRAMNRLTELKRMGNKRGLTVRPTRQQAKDECVIC